MNYRPREQTTNDFGRTTLDFLGSIWAFQDALQAKYHGKTIQQAFAENERERAMIDLAAAQRAVEALAKKNPEGKKNDTV